MLKQLVTLAFILFSSCSFADRICSQNIDKVQLFYVNGMFTDEIAFEKNIHALNRFQRNNLSQFEINDDVAGSHNYSESFLLQIYEVARHKLQDLDENAPERAVIAAIIGGYLDKLSKHKLSALNWVFEQVMAENTLGIVNETDYQNARTRLTSKLNDCARTILVVHSQGNFYGNRLFTDVSQSFTYPNSYSLIDYPVLGYMGIANPTYSVGGPYGMANPEIAKTITNANDIVMGAVRLVIGAIEADPESTKNIFDSSGHGLVDSYLFSFGQDATIAKMMSDIVKNLTPFPLFEQHPSGSSAISYIGYSKISEILDIRFRYGGGYRYSNVPEGVWDKFYWSTSHGTHFNKAIKDRYSYEKIEH